MTTDSASSANDSPGEGGPDEPEELPPWAPPSAAAVPPGPSPLDPPPPDFHPPGPGGGQAEAGWFDRSGAAAAALGFGLVAGFGLPPLLFWPTFAIVRGVGAADLVSLLIPLIVAFAVPIALLVRVQGLLRRSTPRYDGARSALTVAASVTLGMWLLVALLGGLAIVALRSLA